MNVFNRLYTNARIFPRLTTLAVAVYVATAIVVGTPFGMAAHSFNRGLKVGIVVSLLFVVANFILYFVIASNPHWYNKCQRAADALYLIFSSPAFEPQTVYESEYEDEQIAAAAEPNDSLFYYPNPEENEDEDEDEDEYPENA
jgi:hypothetical protein